MNQSQRERIQEAFAGSMPLPPRLESHLKATLASVLRNPGSLVRPEIVAKIAAAYELAEAAGTDLAIALEYFHTASLLFDDLPSMDDATERRGNPCVHSEYGESAAILAALALINRAYALAWKAISFAPLARQEVAAGYVEARLGVGGLLNGQSMDLNYASLPHDQRTTEQIAMGKTVSLIRLTLVLPAILGGAGFAEVQILERIALYWGLSYQVLDDLKDVLQSSSESGKTALRDFALDRPNLAVVLGTHAAFVRLERLITMGDRMVNRLIVRRPATAFLTSLRAELSNEADQLMRGVCASPASGRG